MTARKKGAKAKTTKRAAPRKRGRPSAFRPEYAEQVEQLCLLGATDKELAQFFGVAESTLNTWKQVHPEFLESLKAGKEQADARVAQSLFHRALGYEHPAVKILTVAIGDNQGSEVQQVPYTERYPPDTTAAIFWLKNRQPERWRDKHEHQHEAGDSLAALIASAYQGGTAKA